MIITNKIKKANTPCLDNLFECILDTTEKQRFSDEEKDMAREQMIDNEIDEAIQAKHEKLANKAWEDTEGDHPDTHGDSPSINIIGDRKI